MTAVLAVSSFGSLGPGVFIILHQMQLLKCIVLIGSHENNYIVDSLRVSINPFDQVFFPQNIFPSV